VWYDGVDWVEKKRNEEETSRRRRLEAEAEARSAAKEDDRDSTTSSSSSNGSGNLPTVDQTRRALSLNNDTANDSFASTYRGRGASKKDEEPSSPLSQIFDKKATFYLRHDRDLSLLIQSDQRQDY